MRRFCRLWGRIKLVLYNEANTRGRTEGYEHMQIIAKNVKHIHTYININSHG